MSGVGVLGLLWAAAGIWVGFRWWSERGAALGARTPPGGPEAPTPGSGPVRFGRPAEGGAVRRRQAMRLAYATGATAVATGLLVGSDWVLGLGAAMVNLGTMYRLLVFLLDEAPEPAPGRAARPLPAHRPGRRRPPALSGALAGNLVD